MATRKAKFKLGQVVSVRSFYGNFERGETGPGFKGKRGWRHGWQFGKIVKLSPPSNGFAPYCYFIDSWISAQPEDNIRAITETEAGRG